MQMDKVQIFVTFVMIIGGSYLSFLLIGAQAIIVAFSVLLCLVYLLVRRWNKIKEQGLIALCNARLRSLLLERSLFDIFRDIVYFPYITKIISAYLRIAATKPHPSEISSILKDLPQEVVEISNKKGILSLAPDFVEQMILPSHNRQILPQNYGRSDLKWDNAQRYEKSENQVHEQTIEKRVVHFLDGKLGWPAAFGLLAITTIGVTHMRPHRFKKMMIQNVTFACMLLSFIALLVKARKVMRHRKRQMLAIENKQE